MANTKISELPLFTGNTAGVYLVMDSADLSTTYRVHKENITGISGEQNKFAFFDATNSITSSQYLYSVNAGNTIGIGTDGYNQVEPERLIVDSGGSYNIATFQTSQANSYGEVNIKNFGGGALSSTDLVLWNDGTTEESGYFNIGINSSNYAAADGTLAGDAYIFTMVSDLYIAANAADSHGHVHIIGGGKWDKPQISVFNDGTIGFNTRANPTDATIPTSGFTYEFSGSVKMADDLKVDGMVTSSVVEANKLRLYPNDPLPSATLGTLAVSGSHLYFHNGSGWNQIG
jgi:hypothetical protein